MSAKSILIGTLALACVVVQQARAAEIEAPARDEDRARFVLPPEQHIIEVAIHPPQGRQYIINGRVFTAKSDACLGWEAGNRIQLVEGDWRGWCQSVVIYNRSLRQTCEMSCGYW